MKVVRVAAGLCLCFTLFAASMVTVGAAGCQFVLGFKTLHDLIPAVVGDCAADESYNPQNGDGFQVTTKGLLVWRKADNFTAFTDGYHTWVNGPYGIQERLNDNRFWWEQQDGTYAVVNRDGSLGVPPKYQAAVSSLTMPTPTPAPLPTRSLSCFVSSPQFNATVTFFSLVTDPTPSCLAFANQSGPTLAAALKQVASSDASICSLLAGLANDPVTSLICGLMKSVDGGGVTLTVNPGKPLQMTDICWGGNSTTGTAYYVGDTGRHIVGSAMCSLLPSPTYGTS